jgi:hypothetical protein
LKIFQALLDRKDVRPGCVFSLQTFEVFRRMLLWRLNQAERLSESFMQNLLSWVHSGFSVYAGSPVDAVEVASMESQPIPSCALAAAACASSPLLRIPA